jgi:hypothetical protein
LANLPRDDGEAVASRLEKWMHCGEHALGIDPTAPLSFRSTRLVTEKYWSTLELTETMPPAVALNAEPRTCVIKLRRIGDAAGEVVENQQRTVVPTIGDVIEVTVNDATVAARVVQISSADVEGSVTIDADELSSSYVWDTFTALAQHDAGEIQSDVQTSVPPMKPHLAFQATLNLVRQCHALSREVLQRPKPDMRAALRHMRIARRAGWLVFPYIENEELRRRVISYKPMSEEEWEQLWPSHLSNKK